MQFDPAEDMLISKDAPPVSLIQQTLERILLTFDKKFGSLLLVFLFSFSGSLFFVLVLVLFRLSCFDGHCIFRGRYVAAIFLELPSRDELPGYFEIVTNPISLTEIVQKVGGGAYQGSFEQFARDLHLLIDNAKLFNEANSMVYKDAKHFEVFLKKKNYLLLLSQKDDQPSFICRKSLLRVRPLFSLSCGPN